MLRGQPGTKQSKSEEAYTTATGVLLRQVAIQGGRYVGKLIHRRLVDKPAPAEFRYFDKGNMAVVGKGFAIVQTGPFKLSGFLPWLMWAFVHIQFLAMCSMRVSVFSQWMWTFFTGSRGSRIIVNHYATPSANAAAVAQAEPAVSRSRRTRRTRSSSMNAPQDGRRNDSPVANAVAHR